MPHSSIVEKDWGFVSILQRNDFMALFIALGWAP